MEALTQELGMGFFASPFFADVRGKLGAHAATEEILESASRLEDLLAAGDAPLVDPLYYSLGKWVESSRLAALAGEGRYFAGREFKRPLRILKGAHLGEEIVRRITEVESMAALEARPLAELIAALDEIINFEGVR
jgi:hypothetical protein